MKSFRHGRRNGGEHGLIIAVPAAYTRLQRASRLQRTTFETRPQIFADEPTCSRPILSSSPPYFKVIAPIDGSTAAKAGLKTNDIVTHVGGVSVNGFTLDQLVLDKLIGPPGSQVRLTVLRQGQDKPLELTLVRDLTPFKAVRSRLEGGDIGHLRIALMNEWTMPALEKAIKELSNEMPANKLKGYVIDLRNTPHRARFAAVSIADAFLQEGEIVSVRGANPEQINHFNASHAWARRAPPTSGSLGVL